eukprot:TRINITY_DN19217_c0_g1_i2.p1 TRINITY_DN19217_c0_g1~~TRINITY_DN19217_c0_g1_i2.p1  ORF type:complete len:476 (+),score=97.07 TRINITY_DN19217_c0_g1_i2:69-1496(+)
MPGLSSVFLAATAGLAVGDDVVNSQSAFVHLFEWSWSDIALECEQWLGPKGFHAVQVSPPTEHIQGSQWWTRYQPVTYELVSRSGNESEFRSMIQRCKTAGVNIYVDAVFNHVAGGSGTGVAGGKYGNRATPIYGPQDMHHGSDEYSNCGVSNYDDKQNVQYCDLVGLPDLCTSCEYVQKTVAGYINNVVAMGAAGIRIDAAKHMDAGELKQLLTGVPSGLWRFQEVISGNNEAVQPNMYYGNGDVSEFNYARQLAPNFLNDGKMQYLGSFGESWGLMPSGDAVVFMDNHDTQRGEAQLTYKNGMLYQLANIFMLAHPYGYPKVMSSYAFDNKDQGPPSSPVHSGSSVACSGGPNSLNGVWICEHRWTAIANMVAWRRSAGSAPVGNFQKVGADVIIFCRGQAACVAINRQSSQWSGNAKLSLPSGSYCDVIQSDDTSSCPKVQVNSDGSVNLQIPAMSAVALHTGKKAEETLLV